MLDRVFLSKLSGKGKTAYWVGQICLLGVLLAVMFSGGGMGDSYVTFIVAGIGIVVVWGIVCISVWPVSKEFDDMNQGGRDGP